MTARGQRRRQLQRQRGIATHRVEGFRLVRPLVLFARFSASEVVLIGTATPALAAEQKLNSVFILV